MSRLIGSTPQIDAVPTYDPERRIPVELPECAAKMIRGYVEIHGDPFEPWDSMTNYSTQEKEVKCHGCAAVGVSRRPDWAIKISHEPGCAWLAFRRAFGLST